MSHPPDSISSLPDPEEFFPLSDEPEELPEYMAPSAPRLGREGVALGVICLALAAVLQFLRLGHREIFEDEFFTLQALAGESKESFVNSLLQGHLPLYYWMLEGWSRLTDIASAGRETLLRLPSALCAFLTCAVFFFHARRYLRGMAFAVAMLLMALNPILVAAAHDATPFALMALAAALTHHFGVRALDEGGWRTWIPYVLSALLGALTHPLFWFLPTAQFAFALTRPRRTPRPFYVVAVLGAAVATGAATAAILYSETYFPQRLDVRAPAIDDLIKGLVGLTLGDFMRHGVNSFFRAVMYLLFLSSLGLSVAYYRVRSMEASAMPEGVGWIDQTQDVVGTWKRLSLSSFLAYQWFTFLIPAAATLFLGTFAPRYDLDPEQLLVCLPSLAVLLAVGVDFARRRGGKLILALSFVLIMAYYGMEAITFRGYGVRHAIKLIDNEGYDAGKALLVYSAPGKIEPALLRYRDDKETMGIEAPETPEHAAEIQSRTLRVAEGREEVFAVYHDDRQTINKKVYAPVRDAFSPQFGWELEKKWTLSRELDTELRVYRKAAPPQAE